MQCSLATLPKPMGERSKWQVITQFSASGTLLACAPLGKLWHWWAISCENRHSAVVRLVVLRNCRQAWLEITVTQQQPRDITANNFKMARRCLFPLLVAAGVDDGKGIISRMVLEHGTAQQVKQHPLWRSLAAGAQLAMAGERTRPFGLPATAAPLT